MKKLKRAIITIVLVIAALAVYVEVANRNSKNMSYRQKVLKAFYPVWMWVTKITGKNTEKLAGGNKAPQVSFYSLKTTLNNNDTLDFSSLKGKKVLLVNTASDCGYTGQYADLQKLYEEYADKLVVIGFPANDFKEQEKGSDEEIASFCKLNYGVTFPLAKKSVVVKSGNQGPVFQWLTNASANGWNEEPPAWNFTKFLVNEEGILINYFGPSVSPLSSDIQKAITAK